MIHIIFTGTTAERLVVTGALSVAITLKLISVCRSRSKYVLFNTVITPVSPSIAKYLLWSPTNEYVMSPNVPGFFHIFDSVFYGCFEQEGEKTKKKICINIMVDII